MMAIPEFELIYKDYAEKVTRYIYSKNIPECDVPDVCQEIFKKVFTRLTTYDASRGSIGTWVYAISQSTVMDYFRHHRSTLSLDAEEGAANAAPASALSEQSSPSIETLTLRKEDLDTLAQALKLLSLRERQIIVLYYYSEIPLTAIAEKLELSAANVRMIKTRALRKLKKEFKKST